MRRLWISTAIVCAAMLVVGIHTTAHAQPSIETRHRSGLVIVSSVDRPWADPMSATAAKLLDEAKVLAETNPTEFGYPWYDRTNGAVVVDTTSNVGAQLAARFGHGSGRVATPTRERRVSHSFARLERVKHEAIELTTRDLPDGEAIFLTEPDPQHNRVIIFVKRMSDGLLNALAKRYGTDAIAVRHMPGAMSSGDGRDNDTSPFYGGAKLIVPFACTSAFSWRYGSTNMMLMAGHCVPNGGDISTPAAHLGYVTATSNENWNPGTGTVYLPSQTTYRGDLALASVASGSYSAATIYRGGPGSSTSATVAEMWNRRPQTDDKYCVGGYVTGEKCSWSVYATGIDFRWDSGEIARNMVRSFYRTDACTFGGDSGGPVYTVRPDGKIAAKGINHGKSTVPVIGCMNVFTDIWDAYYGLPGNLATA